MASISLDLHRRRCFHKDLYLCHFYIAEEDVRRLPEWAGRVRLIDLHRLARHPWTWPWWQSKDLAQLLYSSDVPGVTAPTGYSFARLHGRRPRPAGGALGGLVDSGTVVGLRPPRPSQTSRVTPLESSLRAYFTFHQPA